MMTYDDWLAAIHRRLAEFADLDFQRRVWAGIGPPIPNVASSWEEAYCCLFDDACFEDFLEHHATAAGCTAAQIAALSEFRAAANRYEPPADPRSAGAARIIGDPAWLEVVQAAQRAIAAFPKR